MFSKHCYAWAHSALLVSATQIRFDDSTFDAGAPVGAIAQALMIQHDASSLMHLLLQMPSLLGW